MTDDSIKNIENLTNIKETEILKFKLSNKIKHISFIMDGNNRWSIKIINLNIILIIMVQKNY